ncbi:MAG: hypothetical protein RSE91_00465, partial [Bacilli bacterium]
EGALGVVQAEGQLQIIYGPGKVNKVTEEVNKIVGKKVLLGDDAIKETKDKLLLNPNDINLICLKELIMDINHAIIELCIEYQLGSLLGNYLSITNGHDETIIYKQMLINDWEKYLKDANSNIYQFRDTAIDKILTKHK